MSLKRRGGKASTDRVDTPAVPIHGVGLTRRKSSKHAAAPQALRCIPDENSNGKPDLPFEARLECDLSCGTWHSVFVLVPLSRYHDVVSKKPCTRKYEDGVRLTL